ncbi:MAG: hypothetical protein WBZ36_23435 [Candidatus Nitrosopolaris sp.]
MPTIIKRPTKQRGLVLQSGGTLGAYEAGVLMCYVSGFIEIIDRNLTLLQVLLSAQ